jgi:hypothetical protein
LLASTSKVLHKKGMTTSPIDVEAGKKKAKKYRKVNI